VCLADLKDSIYHKIFPEFCSCLCCVKCYVMTIQYGIQKYGNVLITNISTVSNFTSANISI